MQYKCINECVIWLLTHMNMPIVILFIIQCSHLTIHSYEYVLFMDITYKDM